MIEPPLEPLLPQMVLERSTGFVQIMQSTAVSGFASLKGFNMACRGSCVGLSKVTECSAAVA